MRTEVREGSQGEVAFGGEREAQKLYDKSTGLEETLESLLRRKDRVHGSADVPQGVSLRPGGRALSGHKAEEVSLCCGNPLVTFPAPLKKNTAQDS